MKPATLFRFLLFLIIPYLACHKSSSTSPDDRYDLGVNGIPKFAAINYIELSKIHRISKFRSSVGHDYGDDFEHCRSMKHYFEPMDTVDWSAVAVFSPVSGTVVKVFEEWAGTQVHIQSSAYPAFSFMIFHINLSAPLNIGDHLNAGQQLGAHIGPQTMSDIAIGVNSRDGWTLISWFEVMTDSLFQEYQTRGMDSRADAIISKEARDADTLKCGGDTFLNTGALENWVILN